MRKLATRGQIRKYEELHAAAEVELSAKSLKRFRSLAVADASKAIGLSATALALRGLDAHRPETGDATTAQLRYLAGLRARLMQPIDVHEMRTLKKLTTTALHELTSETMRALQDRNDALGVPVPKWRRKSPKLYDPAKLNASQLATLNTTRVRQPSDDRPAKVQPAAPRRPSVTEYERATGSA